MLNTALREKAEEAVGVLTCFCQESLGLSDTDIAADRRKDTADADRRVAFALQKNV